MNLSTTCGVWQVGNSVSLTILTVCHKPKILSIEVEEGRNLKKKQGKDFQILFLQRNMVSNIPNNFVCVC